MGIAACMQFRWHVCSSGEIYPHHRYCILLTKWNVNNIINITSSFSICILGIKRFLLDPDGIGKIPYVVNIPVMA